MFKAQTTGHIRFTSEDQFTKQTNIKAIYNQCLIRNYYKRGLKCQAARLGFGVSRTYK
jgi:hypothetical protein